MSPKVTHLCSARSHTHIKVGQFKVSQDSGIFKEMSGGGIQIVISILSTVFKECSATVSVNWPGVLRTTTSIKQLNSIKNGHHENTMVNELISCMMIFLG